MMFCLVLRNSEYFEVILMQLLYIALNLMDFTLENRTNYKKS